MFFAKKYSLIFFYRFKNFLFTMSALNPGELLVGVDYGMCGTFHLRYRCFLGLQHSHQR